ncbi:MAG: NAD(+)/NADH kinase [Chloroflexi bacterium]|nr:NAD(+)/NADH kinase [Chloroflexota bacterium]
MSLVGIIANPASGKDIRRIVARGMTVPDHEKINIVRRILIGIAALGVDSIRWMPDAADLVGRAADGLQLGLDARALDLPITDSPDDTTRAAEALRERGADCIVVLGGDGTCRAAAKGAGEVPLLPISTGTNNAFPQFVEGTLAGLAAAIVARGIASTAITRAPCLRILRESTPIDLALIDVVSFEGMVGARAVWQMERVRQLVSVRYGPGTIGLSAIAGYLGLQPPSPDVALTVTLGAGERRVVAPVAPGVIEELGVRSQRWLEDGETVRIEQTPCVLALDGERELSVRNGMLIDVQFDSHGPRVVQVQQALELGVQYGMFDPARWSPSKRSDPRLGI